MLGGSAVNTAVVLSRLGLESAVMGAVGDDEPGHLALFRLGSIGVDTELTSVSQTHHTAMNTILVTPDRERTMIGARGANVIYTAPPGWNDGVGWLHVSGYGLMKGSQRESALATVETAGDHGIPTSLDVPLGVGERIRPIVDDRLADLAIVSGSRAALSEVTGSDDPIESLRRGGVQQVAMTAGAEQLIVAGDGFEITLTPPRIDPIDMTGAGDAFIAGLIAARVGGLEPGPSAVLAAATGAAATLVSGASETLANPKTLPDLLSPERWSDTAQAWLEDVRSFVTTPP